MTIAQKYLRLQVALTDLINALPPLSPEHIVLKNTRRILSKHLDQLKQVDDNVLSPKNNLDAIRQLASIDREARQYFPYSLPVVPTIRVNHPMKPVFTGKPQDSIPIEEDTSEEIVLDPKED